MPRRRRAARRSTRRSPRSGCRWLDTAPPGGPCLLRDPTTRYSTSRYSSRPSAPRPESQNWARRTATRPDNGDSSRPRWLDTADSWLSTRASPGHVPLCASSCPKSATLRNRQRSARGSVSARRHALAEPTKPSEPTGRCASRTTRPRHFPRQLLDTLVDRSSRPSLNEVEAAWTALEIRHRDTVELGVTSTSRSRRARRHRREREARGQVDGPRPACLSIPPSSP